MESTQGPCQSGLYGSNALSGKHNGSVPVLFDACMHDMYCAGKSEPPDIVLLLKEERVPLTLVHRHPLHIPSMSGVHAPVISASIAGQRATRTEIAPTVKLLRSVHRTILLPVKATFAAAK